MISSIPVSGYSYRAIQIMEKLSPKHQRQIEWLRQNSLTQLALNNSAHVFGNYPELEYKISVATDTLMVEIHYYLKNSNTQANIFDIIL